MLKEFLARWGNQLLEIWKAEVCVSHQHVLGAVGS